MTSTRTGAVSQLEVVDDLLLLVVGQAAVQHGEGVVRAARRPAGSSSRSQFSVATRSVNSTTRVALPGPTPISLRWLDQRVELRRACSSARGVSGELAQRGRAPRPPRCAARPSSPESCRGALDRSRRARPARRGRPWPASTGRAPSVHRRYGAVPFAGCSQVSRQLGGDGVLGRRFAATSEVHGLRRARPSHAARPRAATSGQCRCRRMNRCSMSCTGVVVTGRRCAVGSSSRISSANDSVLAVVRGGRGEDQRLGVRGEHAGELVVQGAGVGEVVRLVDDHDVPLLALQVGPVARPS